MSAYDEAVVVGVDGSDAALSAVRWAAREAQRTGRRLRLIVSVWVSPFGYLGTSDPAVDALARRVGEVALDRAELLVREVAPGLDVTREPSARPALETLERASTTAWQTVVGRRGSGGFARLLAGSVALGLPARSHGPVVVVPHAFRDDGSGPVVVGLEGSESDRELAAAAYREASFRGVELVAVHSWSDNPLLAPQLVRNPEIAAQLAADEGDERRLLAEQLDGWSQQYPDVAVRSVVPQGSPAGSVLDAADTAQLIVLGSRGRNALRAMLLGSTSRAVISHAQCPVLVIPRPD